LKIKLKATNPTLKGASHEGEIECESRLPQVHLPKYSLNGYAGSDHSVMGSLIHCPSRSPQNGKKSFMEFRYKLHQVSGS
jgi:hypothetical protein